MQNALWGRVSSYFCFVFIGSLAVVQSGQARSEEVRIQFRDGETTTVYRPFSPELPVSTPEATTWVWLNADNDPRQTVLRATQRSLGFREVDYKALFSRTLAHTPVTPTTTDDVTVYDYSQQNNRSSDLVGFWKSKNLPIVIGPDGRAYITDGHHTTAGYLAAVTAPREIIPGHGHVVLGHIVANHYKPAAGTVKTDDAWWSARQRENNALLHTPQGNQLVRSADRDFGAMQAVSHSVLPMPEIPGKASMTNDDYRALTWGMADGIVKSATDEAGVRLIGYLKTSVANPTVDINFVEFYWAGFLQNRVIWDNNKSGSPLTTANSDRNLIEAPLGFFAAVANGIALAKSEVYRDQFGRSLSDYNSDSSATNTLNWARDSASAGRLAKPTDSYTMYLLDDSTVRGDITPSLLSQANNTLHINSTAGQTVTGVIANFGKAVEINRGAAISTQWRDPTLNTPAYNSTLTIAPGTGTVTFAAANTYTGPTTVGGGTLKLAGAGSVANSAEIIVGQGATLDVTAVDSPFQVAVKQTLTNHGVINGDVESLGTIRGGGRFSGNVTLGRGARLAPGNSPYSVTCAHGLTLQDGCILDFNLTGKFDRIYVTGGKMIGSGAGGVTVNVAGDSKLAPSISTTLIDWSGSTVTGVEAADFKLVGVPKGYSGALKVVGTTLQVALVAQPNKKSPQAVIRGNKSATTALQSASGRPAR